MCYIHKTYIQINLRTPNPCQIITVICQNADGRVHVEHPPLLNRPTMMVAAFTITVAISGRRHHCRLAVAVTVTVIVTLTAAAAAAAKLSLPTMPLRLPPFT